LYRSKEKKIRRKVKVKMNNRIEEIKEALKTARSRYERRLAEIRQDTHYSDYGKADLIATEDDSYRRKRESLLDELNEVKANERARLERAAFNAPRGQEESYRNAISKANSITDRSERQKLFALAEKTGDTLMLRAMAAVGHGVDADEHHWQTVIAASKHDRDLHNLVEFESEHGTLRTAQQKMALSFELSAPSKPSEAALANRASERNASR